MSEITDYLIDIEIAKQTNEDIIKGLEIAKEIVNTSGHYNFADLNELENKIEINRIVTWMIQEGITKTINGNWHISFDEIMDTYGVSEEWLSEACEDIRDELDNRKEILPDTWLDEDDDKNIVGFDMNFCLSVCKQWDETKDWNRRCEEELK